MIEQASEVAVAAFAPDAYAHMIETLCGGDPRAIERVGQSVRAMVGNLDVFQLRPEVDGLLRRLRDHGLKLGIVANQPESARERLARAGIGGLFDYQGLSAYRQPPASWWVTASTTTSLLRRRSAWRRFSCAAAGIAGSNRARRPRRPTRS
jgi:hypothetical protein